MWDLDGTFLRKTTIPEWEFIRAKTGAERLQKEKKKARSLEQKEAPGLVSVRGRELKRYAKKNEGKEGAGHHMGDGEDWACHGASGLNLGERESRYKPHKVIVGVYTAQRGRARVGIPLGWERCATITII